MRAKVTVVVRAGHVLRPHGVLCYLPAQGCAPELCMTPWTCGSHGSNTFLPQPTRRYQEPLLTHMPPCPLVAARTLAPLLISLPRTMLNFAEQEHHSVLKQLLAVLRTGMGGTEALGVAAGSFFTLKSNTGISAFHPERCLLWGSPATLCGGSTKNSSLACVPWPLGSSFYHLQPPAAPRPHGGCMRLLAQADSRAGRAAGAAHTGKAAVHSHFAFTQVIGFVPTITPVYMGKPDAQGLEQPA